MDTVALAGLQEALRVLSESDPLWLGTVPSEALKPSAIPQELLLEFSGLTVADMTRPKGAPNEAPSKFELVEYLKSVGIRRSEILGNEEAFRKSHTKAQLLEWAKNAGWTSSSVKARKEGGLTKYLADGQKGSTSNPTNFNTNVGNTNKVNHSDVDAGANNNSGDQTTNQEPVPNTSTTIAAQVARELNNVMSGWDKVLICFGYGHSNIIPPNGAVQLVLSCIRIPEIHKHFLMREATVPREHSVIMFLGFSNMTILASKFREFCLMRPGISSLLYLKRVLQA